MLPLKDFPWALTVSPSLVFEESGALPTLSVMYLLFNDDIFRDDGYFWDDWYCGVVILFVLLVTVLSVLNFIDFIRFCGRGKVERDTPNPRENVLSKFGHLLLDQENLWGSGQTNPNNLNNNPAAVLEGENEERLQNLPLNPEAAWELPDDDDDVPDARFAQIVGVRGNSRDLILKSCYRLFFIGLLIIICVFPTFQSWTHLDFGFSLFLHFIHESAGTWYDEHLLDTLLYTRGQRRMIC